MVGPIKRRGSKAAANEPVIDVEFQSRIPPLTKEEERLLEGSLATYGCLDTIKTWGGKVLDGHNRLKLCKKLHIRYQTEDVPLPDREAALDWIDRNQLGRRNLHPDTAALLRGRVYNRRKQKVGRPSTEEKICHNDIFSGDKPSETHKQLAEEFGVSPRTVNRDGAYAAAVDTLKPIAPELEAQVIRGEGPPRKRVIEAAQAAKESPEKARGMLKDTDKKTPHVSHASGNQEWYTPEEYITAARKVMGEIDVDPASCAEANKTIRATTYYSAEDDGLTKEWHGRIWLQPPYAEMLVKKFCEKLISEHLEGRTTEAILLTNNATETGWFQDVSGFASATCAPRGRIKYIRPGGVAPGSPLQGQVFMYLGPNAEKFAKHFSVFGVISYPAPPTDAPPAPPPEPEATPETTKSNSPPVSAVPIRKPAPAKPPEDDIRDSFREEYNRIMGIDTRSLTEQLAEEARGFLGEDGVLVCPDPNADEETINGLCYGLSDRVIKGEVTEAIVITYVNITTPRFVTLSVQAAALCLIKDGPIVFYIGQEVKRFSFAFFSHGAPLVSLRSYSRIEKEIRADMEATARLALTRAGVTNKDKQDELLSAEYRKPEHQDADSIM